ncbi:MAG: hypothetical protein ABWK05_07030, partial [Pyrobaculum sp.]
QLYDLLPGEKPPFDDVWKWTGGNPRYLEQLYRAEKPKRRTTAQSGKQCPRPPAEALPRRKQETAVCRRTWTHKAPWKTPLKPLQLNFETTPHPQGLQRGA